MRKPSICFLSSMHPARDKRVFDKEAVTLACAGFEVTHLCPGQPTESGMDKGVRIVTYQRRAGIRGRIAQLRQLYRNAVALDADVYHCNEVDSWFIGVLLKITRGKGCVFDVHEDYPSTFAQSRFPPPVQPIVSAAVRLGFLCLAPFTDRFVLAKRSVSRDFRVSDKRKLLVRNFTPRPAVAPGADEAQKDHSAPFRMIHLGLFSKVRGWPQLLDAMSLMKDQQAKLEVIGEINDGTREQFEARARQLNLLERITIHDWMPFEKAFERLRQADAGLIVFQPGIQNHVYAMPHKMFDYMAAELAVICPHFAVEVAPIVTEEACGLLVEPSDPRDLAVKLDELSADRARCRAMGARGRRSVQDRYNWEAEARGLIELYANWGSSR